LTLADRPATLDQFAPKFLDGYSRAIDRRRAGSPRKKTIIRVDLVRLLAPKSLEAITNEVV